MVGTIDFVDDVDAGSKTPPRVNEANGVYRTRVRT
ncbi:Uncharacterised protein [Mycobacterium tuberculosis]|nr:Uncharacterised protein [Mycobacterium tuberculosis]